MVDHKRYSSPPWAPWAFRHICCSPGAPGPSGFWLVRYSPLMDFKKDGTVMSKFQLETSDFYQKSFHKMLEPHCSYATVTPVTNTQVNFIPAEKFWVTIDSALQIRLTICRLPWLLSTRDFRLKHWSYLN